MDPLFILLCVAIVVIYLFMGPVVLGLMHRFDLGNADNLGREPADYAIVALWPISLIIGVIIYLMDYLIVLTKKIGGVDD